MLEIDYAFGVVERTPVDWNRDNVRKAMEMYKQTREGCFFLGIYMARATFYSDPLPPAKDFWNNIRPHYDSVLQPDSLLVRHGKLGEALEIYKDWGMVVSRFVYNNEAECILRNSINTIQALTLGTGSWKPVPTDFTKPHGRWVHQAGGDTSHFVMYDGSAEASELISDYEGKSMRPVATLEIEKM